LANVNRPVEEKKAVNFLFVRRGGCYERGDELAAEERKLIESVPLKRRIVSGELIGETSDVLASPTAQLLIYAGDFVASAIAKRPNKTVSTIALLLKEKFFGAAKPLQVVLNVAKSDDKDKGVNISDFRFAICAGEFAARLYDSEWVPLAGYNNPITIRLTE
jgi:hypothetical protein